MKINKYLKDNFFYVTIFIICFILMYLIFKVFKVDISIIISILLIFLFFFICSLIYNILRKKKFYDEFLNNLEQLDQKYLLMETLKSPDFYEGKILYNSLKEIDKSMIEKIKEYEYSITDFKEYIEMWIHEVKIPLSSLTLMFHNKYSEDKNFLEQLKRMNDYVDQVLYYVRSENTEKDYLINEVSINKIIKNIALKNKDDFLYNKIDLRIDNINYKVFSDSKWLEFIINQIINNSIKYKSKKDSFINISCSDNKKYTTLNIYDNGIGISSSDLKRVFEKSFTGSNGRNISKSTGMGLYIAEKLVKKLGHTISIKSEVNKYTCVSITFLKNDFYKIK